MSPPMPLVDSPAIDLDIEEWVLGPSTNISNELANGRTCRYRLRADGGAENRPVDYAVRRRRSA